MMPLEGDRQGGQDERVGYSVLGTSIARPESEPMPVQKCEAQRLAVDARSAAGGPPA